MKPEWGQKRICRKCAAHFYDLQRKTFECPKCNTSYSQDDFQLKVLKAEQSKSKKKVDKLPVEENLDIIDEGLHQVIDADDLLEDADDLNDEGVADVIEHEEEN